MTGVQTCALPICFVLFETSNPGAFYESAAVWADVLEIHTVPVIEDADAGPILAKVFKK